MQSESAAPEGRSRCRNALAAKRARTSTSNQRNTPRPKLRALRRPASRPADPPHARLHPWP
eukprot:5957253-Pyramimonas_sp.AAC.1